MNHLQHLIALVDAAPEGYEDCARVLAALVKVSENATLGHINEHHTNGHGDNCPLCFALDNLNAVVGKALK